MTAMTTTFDYRLFAYNPVRGILFAEASDLGLRPGQVPQKITVKGLMATHDFTICSDLEEIPNKNWDDMTIGWTYRSSTTKHCVYIAND